MRRPRHEPRHAQRGPAYRAIDLLTFVLFSPRFDAQHDAGFTHPGRLGSGLRNCSSTDDRRHHRETTAETTAETTGHRIMHTTERTAGYKAGHRTGNQTRHETGCTTALSGESRPTRSGATSLAGLRMRGHADGSGSGRHAARVRGRSGSWIAPRSLCRTWSGTQTRRATTRSRTSSHDLREPSARYAACSRLLPSG